MSRDVVLIISAPEDIHAKAVIGHLVDLGVRPEILDLREFPNRASLAMRFGDRRSTTWHMASGETIDAEQVAAVWWRRPQQVRVDDAVVDPAQRRFAANECHCALNGLWETLRCRWINAPDADAAASHKPYQLDVAPELGLPIPDTLITNDPEEAAAFIDRHDGKAIYKTLSGLPEAWRETRLLRPSERAALSLVRHAPVIFQELIEGDDLRVTVVGECIFAAQMESAGSRYPYDVRMDMTVPVKAVRLDPPTERGVRALMRRLGLEYGAIDLKRDGSGRCVFLEINPAGQFLFIEDLTGLPIAKAVANRLAQPVRPQ
jgi:glutathione synthase/RimK-type ligase-like ATP-grasp enzyme